MKHYLKVVLLAMAVMNLTGCATLFSSKVTSITIDSDPSSADVKDKDGKVLGTTPYSFTPSKEEKYSFYISKKGFEESELGIRPVVNEAALFGDAMLLCLPCIIDLPSKAYLNFPRSSYKVDLQRSAISKDREKTGSLFSDNVFVNINEPRIPFKDKQVLGKVNSSGIKYDSNKENETTGSSVLYTDAVCSEFSQANITSIRCGISRYEREGNGMTSPEKQLYIQPIVQSWDFDLQLKAKKYSGTGNLAVNWQILDPSQNMKVLHESVITCSADFEDRQIKYLFLKLMQKSAGQFIAEDSVYEFVKNRRLLSPQLMKGEAVRIDKAKNPSFEKFKDLVSHCTKAVVTIKQKEGFGSGVIVSGAGYIITNYHVVDENKEVTVKFSTGMSLTAKVIKTNPAADLALLKVEAQDLPSLAFAGEEAETGEEVVAIGTPGDLSLEQTVSKGIVSGKRVIDGKNFLQTDVSINPGNSGGPLLNDKGEILGIITMKLVGKGMEGLGFALTSQDVIKLLNLKMN